MSVVEDQFHQLSCQNLNRHAASNSYYFALFFCIAFLSW